MRILILTTYYPPDSAANGVLMKQLAVDLKGRGHEIEVVTSVPHYDGDRIREGYRGRLGRRDLEDGVGVRRLYLFVPRKKNWLFGRALNYLTWNLLSAAACLLGPRPDVIFVPSPPLTNGLVGFAAGRLRRAPFVYNVQDVYPDIAVRLGVLRSRRSIAFFRRMEKFVYAKAAAVSVISEGFRYNLLAKGVPPGKIEVIPNFADTGLIRPLLRRNAFSAAHGLDDRFVVLFAGNIGLSQGLEHVLEAARRLAGHPEILFLIVGAGAAKPGLVDLAARLGLPNVRFLPFQPYQDIPEMYAASDAGLVPLKRGFTGESVPSKVLSILAAARPLIASVDEGSETWRLAREAGCGLCVPPEDPAALTGAVLDLAGDRERGLRMGAAGRDVVERRYSRPAAATKYEELLIRVAMKGIPRGGR